MRAGRPRSRVMPFRRCSGRVAAKRRQQSSLLCSLKRAARIRLNRLKEYAFPLTTNRPPDSDWLHWVLFGLLLALCLVVGGALFWEEPPDSQGYGHGELSTMRQGGTGERHAQVLWLGVAFGVLQLLLFVACLGFGLRGARGSSGAKRRALLLGGVLYLAVFLVLIVAYQDYLKDPTRLFLSLPLPTAVMLWVLWPFPLYFVFVYSMKFEDWVFRKEDSQRFRELVGSGPPGSSTHTNHESPEENG